MKAWWNLNQTEQIKRSIGGAVFCVILAVAFIFGAAAVCFHANGLKKRCTAQAEGTVISVFPARRYRIQSYLVAGYEVNGVEYRTKGRFYDGYFIFNERSGKTAGIHYNPQNPKESYACNAPLTEFAFTFSVLGGTFLISVPLFLMQASYIRKHGAICKIERS